MDVGQVVGRRGIVTTSIPVGGIGEVRVVFELGSQSFGAYAANAGLSIPRGSRVTVTEYLPPRTVVVTADA